MHTVGTVSRSLLAALTTAGLLAGSPAPEEYLPLAEGRKWTLRSPAAPTPVVFEVLGEQEGVYRVRFENPWMPSILFLRPQGGKYVLTALAVGGRTVPMPGEVVYFDLGAKQGATWSNAIGTMTVLSRTSVVKAGSRSFHDCVQIRETNQKGNRNYWTFAPGVGFVQFGEGQHAFVLDPEASSLSERVPARAPVAPAVVPSGPGRIGLSTNPFAHEPVTPETVQARFKQAVEAGVTFMYISPKWSELEPKAGEFHFRDLEADIEKSRLHGLPVVMNLRVVDTNQRSLPKDLETRSFQDRSLRDRLLTLIDALARKLEGRLSHVMIGNEIDAYFSPRPREVEAYAELYGVAARRLKELVPGLPVSATVTFGGLSEANGRLGPILDQTDFLALTYYPLEADFTFRDPATVGADFARILQAAGEKKVLLQEVGYSTSALNRSSEEKQAEFVAKVFAELRRQPGRFVGANFFLMSDFSEAMVEQFARYYGLPHADRFRSFLATLGLFDKEGRPKKSWAIFRGQALAMKRDLASADRR